MCQIAVFPSALNPNERKLLRAQEGQSINEWLDESGYREQLHAKPIVIHYNGVEIVESDYDKRLYHNDHLMLVALPEWQAIATWVIDNWILIAYYAAVALYVSSAVPTLPNAADTAEGSPTYSLSARGNRARLGQPKPVLYGTMRTYPDLASTAYSEYDANGDQYLFQIFEVTLGHADVDMNTARFEDTPLNNFSDVEYNVIQPGGSPTLYPGEVITSGEVSGIEIDATPIGDYVANPVGTNITQIGFDLVAIAGLFEQDKKSGELMHHSVQFQFEAQLIDDSDIPQGSWLVLDTIIMQGASRDAIRHTYRYTVDPGRYQARVTRIGAPSDIVRISDNVQWAQLKGYVADEIGPTDTTRVEIVIRASEQLGNKALSKFNTVSSRWLPVWNEVTGWSNDTPTKNPVWAFCDTCRAYYGGKRADAFINLAELKPLADQYDSGEIEFNGVFDSEGDVWSSLQHITTAAFATRIDELGVYTMVRDTQQPQAVAAFTMRNILRGSFQIDDAGVLEETANAVRAWFYDRDQDYRHVSMLCALDGSPADNIRDVNLFGVTDANHAHRLGMYLAAQNRYRRRYIEWETGIEGRLVRYGDLVKVSHFLLGEVGIDQISGEVTEFNGGDELTLNELLPDFTDPWIYLRGKNGEPLGPFEVQKIGLRKVRVLESFPFSELSFDAGYERTHFAIGEGNNFLADVKVTSAKPAGNGRVKLRGFVDNPIVYSIADGVPVPPVTSLPPSLDITPRVTNLVADVRGTAQAPEVHLTWSGENADKYLVEFSADNGSTFAAAGQGVSYEPRFTYRPPTGVLIFRVAGVNLFQGAWLSIPVDTSLAGYTAPLPPTNLSLRSSFIGAICELQWEGEYSRYRLEIEDDSNSNTYIATVDGEAFDFTYQLARSAGIGRAFEVRVWSMGDNGLTSNTPIVISVVNPAPVVLSNLATDNLLGQAVINFDWPADSDIDGISVWKSATGGFTPSASNLAIATSHDPVITVPVDEGETVYLIVAAVDVWGDEGLNYSGQFSVTGKIVDTSDILLDLTQVQTDLAAAEQEITNTNTTLGQVQTDLTTAEQDITNTSNALGQVQTDLTTAEQDITNTSNTLGQVQTDLTTAEQDITNTSNTLGQVQTDLTAAEQDITNTNNTLGQVQTDVAALQVIEGAFPVGTTDISDDAITTPKLSANSVTSIKINALAITADKIAANAITSDKINALAVTAAKMAASTITADKIAANAITSDKINALAVTAAKMAASTITADKIAANAITSDKINALAVTAAKMAASTITADKIAANAITSDKINALAVTAAKMAASTITADKIAANAITSDKINALAITAAKIAANTITADKLSVSELSAIVANLGNVTAGRFSTTASATAARVEIEAEHTYPFWIGSGTTKNYDNALVYFDQASNNFVVKEHGASGAILFATGSGIDFSSLNLGDMAFVDQITSSNASTFINNAVIGTTLIADAAITAAKIQDLEVDTQKLAGQAVTIPVSAYTKAETSLACDFTITSGDATPTSWANLQSCTILSSGAPISIFTTAVLKKPNNLNHSLAWLRIYCSNGETVNAVGYDDSTNTISNLNYVILDGLSAAGISYQVPVTLTAQHTPGPGVYTYYLQALSGYPDGNFTAIPRNVVALNRHISLLETKK
jgi:Putative phage tail protein